MWTRTKETSPMGIHAVATPTKRKQNFDIEKEEKYNVGNQIKSNRWNNNPGLINRNNTLTGIIDNTTRLEALSSVSCESWNIEPTDNISRLQAIAVPDDPWGLGSNKSTLATTLLNSEDIDDDDDEFDDDYEDEQNIIPNYGLKYQCPPQRAYSSSVQGYIKASLYSEAFLQQNGSKVSPNSLLRMGNFSWTNTNNSSCYVPTEGSHSQQTIRCAENGKSYLDLGSSNLNAAMDAKRPKKCCDGRGAWCNGKSCYKEIRLRIRNISMFKLSRFRQISEQSLYKSVLICNTLKQIEKEIDSDSRELCNKVNSQFSLVQTIDCTKTSDITLDSPNTDLEQPISYTHLNLTENKNFTHPHNQKQNSFLFNTQSCSSDSLHPYDHYPFRDSQSGRATPFPTSNYNADTDSGYGDDESNRSINWSSVLSLSSQSALDPLNNNDLFSTITPTSVSANSPNVAGTSTALALTPISSSNQTTSSSGSMSTLEYGFLDMDLSLGNEFTELLPSCKLSSNEILKTISSSLSPKFGHESDLESPAHIMVVSSTEGKLARFAKKKEKETNYLPTNK